jgi:hypothetical protein
MARFVQIEEAWINPEHVVMVLDGVDGAWLYFADGTGEPVLAERANAREIVMRLES